MLRRVSSTGFLSPTVLVRHPLLNAILRLAIALTPVAVEYIEKWAARERVRRATEAEATRSMHTAMTIEQAREVLGVDARCEGANVVPFRAGTEAHRVAQQNFRHFFVAAGGTLPEHLTAPAPAGADDGGEREGKAGKAAGKPVPRNDYLAGKFSHAFRQLVDANWDKK